ncbi:MAG: NADH-quinone oxidoreductase subunit NuoN [Bacteroidetes bacterium]|nr:NADH-quinone oxidoreductase subunit NuoN [Bacteroidota bacterium]
MTELIILSLTGVAALVSEFLNLRKILLPLAILALLVVLGLSFSHLGTSELVYNMASFDGFSRPFLMVLCTLGVLWFWGFRRFFEAEKTTTDYFALTLFSFAGAVCMVSYTNLAMLFLGVEILSIPVYVLAGSNKSDVKGNEASFKYFLLGAFSSAFLLFGIALLYGATGTFDLAEITSKTTNLTSQNQGLLQVGFVLTVAAFAFKVAAAPFHFWAPDVYEGSPTPVTAYMVTVVKVAAFAALLKFFQAFQNAIPQTVAWSIYGLCFLTLMVANFIAASQKNVKRLMAYSSISHTGFMLIGIFCQKEGAEHLLTYYALVYGIASLTAFRVLWYLRNEVADIQDFRGLLHTNQLAAVSVIMAMLSMAGIPPLAGFIAKYRVLAAASAAGQGWLVVVGILASLLAIYYYFKIVIVMFEPSEQAPVRPLHLADKVFLYVCCGLLIALTVWPVV